VLRNKRGWNALATALLLGIVLIVNSPATRSAVPDQTPRRLLVISPHPDDESLAGMAMIQRTLNSGGRVRIVMMTNGDGFRQAAAREFHVSTPKPQHMYQLGLLRQQEELAAIRRLGLRSQDVLMLGYPDAGLHQLWNNHWNLHVPYMAVNGYNRVPYDTAYHQQAPYCGQAVVGDLRQVLADFAPTDVLYPDPHDVHRDHWATSAFTQYALVGLPLPPHEWTYLIHYPNYPQPRKYRPDRPLQPPHKLLGLGTDWHALPLATAQTAQKHGAILSHASQIKMMRHLLESFVRTNDLIGSHATPTVAHGTSANELLTAKHLPHVVVRDARGDQDGFDRAWADIRQIAALRTSQHLHLCIEFAGPVRRAHHYSVSLRMPGSASRLDLTLEQGVLRYAQEASGSLELSYKIHNHRLLLTLPLSALSNVDTVLVSAQVNNEKQMLDSTAWQRIALSANS
jgi:mycothiol S-conjugate amidase